MFGFGDSSLQSFSAPPSLPFVLRRSSGLSRRYIIEYFPGVSHSGSTLGDGILQATDPIVATQSILREYLSQGYLEGAAVPIVNIAHIAYPRNSLALG